MFERTFNSFSRRAPARRRVRSLLSFWLVLVGSFASSSTNARAADVTSTWNGGTNVWTANNWSTANYPDNGNGGLTYNAVVTSGTVTLDQAITVEGLYLASTLNGPNNLTVNNLFEWGGGELAGSGTLTVSAGGMMSIGRGGSYLSRTLVNNGGATWATDFGAINMTGSTFQNNGSFTAIPSVASERLDLYNLGGTSIFNNAGTFIKQGVGEFRAYASGGIGVVFNNSGMVDVQTGKLSLHLGGSHTGDFTGATGALLEFGGDHSFAFGSDITGDLNVKFLNTNTTSGGSVSARSVEIRNSAMTLDASGQGNVVTLSLINSNILGSGNWSVSNLFEWGGGELAGSGTLTVGPSATMTLGRGFNDLSRTLVNNGAATWAVDSGTIRMAGGTFQNEGSFTANATTVGPFLEFYGLGGTNAFSNAGIFTKLGPGTLRTNGVTPVTFNNSGLVHIQQGNLQLLKGGSHSGDFTGATGALLEFGGDHTFASGSDITGELDVKFSSGATTYAGSLNTSGTVSAISGTLTIGGSVTAGSLQTTNSLVSVTGPIIVSDLDISHGTLTGPGDWTVNNQFSLFGNVELSGAGKLTIGPTATMSIVSGGNYIKYFNRNVENNGVTNWTGGNLYLNGTTFTNNGVFTAAPGASAFSTAGTSVFNNAGAFTKSSAGETLFATNTSVGVTFNNSGTVAVQQGALRLLHGGSHTGDFTGAAGTTIEFGGNHTFAAGSDISGDANVSFLLGNSNYAGLLNTTGTVSVTNAYLGVYGVDTLTTIGGSLMAGTLNIQQGASNRTVGMSVNGPVIVSDLNISHGTLTGPGDWTVNNQFSLFGNVELSGAGKLTISPTATMSIVSGGNYIKYFNRNVDNNGVTNWTGGNLYLNGTTFTNNGVFTAAPGASAFSTAGTSVFNNAGAFTKLSAGETLFATNTSVGVAFNNSGTVAVQQGSLRLMHGGSHTGDFTGAAGTTIEFGGNHAFAATSNFSGAANVVFSGGTVNWNGTTTGFTGSIANGSDLHISAGCTLNVGGAFTNSGRLAPGNSPGIITIDGNYTQMPTGVLEIEVGGLTPGTQHDQVIVNDTATLGGRYEFPIIDGFVPQLNDEIVFLQAASVVGSPNSLVAPNLATVNPNVAFQVIKNSTDLRLRFVDKTAIQFKDNTAGGVDPSNWNLAANWQDGTLNRVPLSTDVVNLSRSETGAVQRVEVKNADATSYEVAVQDPTSPIEIGVLNGHTLTASVGNITIGNQATIELDNGSLAAAQAVRVLGGGELSGTGVVGGDLVVGQATSGATAVLSPGITTGALQVTGALVQGAKGKLVIDITGSSTVTTDHLAVAGQATLGGSLEINAAGFVLSSPGQTFGILSAANGTGEFTSVTTIGNDDIYFAPRYSNGGNACGEYVCIDGFYRGDMNRNGAFDADDVSAFALGLMNSTAYFGRYNFFSNSAGDLDGWGTAGYQPNGRLDFDDVRWFRALMASHGMSSASFNATWNAALLSVPEPASCALTSLGGVALLWRTRRRTPS